MTPDLNAALARAILSASAVEKGSQNTFHRYKYASAEAIIEEARVPLASEGLATSLLAYTLTPAHDASYFADLNATYILTHSSGQERTYTSVTPVIVEKGRPADKAVATALTYSLGYFLRGLLLLPRVDEGHDVDKRDDRDKPKARNGNVTVEYDEDMSPEAEAEAVEAIVKRMRACKTLEALRAIPVEAKTLKLSQRARDGLTAVYVECKAALEQAA